MADIANASVEQTAGIDQINKAVANMESLGLKTRLGKYAGALNGFLAGTDAQRGAPWGTKADDAETWIVRQSGTTVTVQALGLTEDFTGISAVVLDARTNTSKQRVIALFQGKEKNQQFDREFIDLARSIYQTNDKRFEVKNRVNQQYNSAIQEQKSYEKY